VIVGVCIEGNGPLPFALDTGAVGSFISTATAARLGLSSSGASRPAAGVGCSETTTTLALAAWSVDNIELAPQQVLSGYMHPLGSLTLAGILGADVLRRFGAIGLDYRSQTLSLAAPEGPPPPQAAAITRGPVAPATDALVQSSDPEPVPVSLVEGQRRTQVLAPVEIAGSTRSFVVDTGAGTSVVSPLVVRDGHLSAAGPPQTRDALACTVTAEPVRTGPWSVGSVRLPSQVVVSDPLPSPSLGGLLGNDVLSRNGRMVLDFAAATLYLNP